MSEESGLYDKLTIGGEQFRRWHETSTLEVMQDGKWTSIPHVAQRAINNLLDASAAAYEDAAKIADEVAKTSRLETRRVAAQDIASALRSRSKERQT